MRILFLILFLWCNTAYALFTDLKFGAAQIADSQWDTNACMTTTTCNIYSTVPGTAYKMPFTGATLSWATGDYVKFEPNADPLNPWIANQYDSNGNLKDIMGIGHVLSMSTDYFFFVGADNWTGQLFSMTQGLANGNAISWTGTLNPTVTQVDTVSANGSTSPLAAGAIVAPVVVPPTPTPNYVSLRPLMTHYLQSASIIQSPPGQDASAAFDGDISTKYLNFNKVNTGVAIKLSQGKVVSSIQLTTGDDFSGRDPASFKISGSNDGVTWTLIDSQNITLSESRGTMSSFTITNTYAYVYYNIIFPTVKNPDTTCGFDCNSMQIAEIVLIYDENNPTTSVDIGTVTWLPFPSVYCCGGSGSAFNANPGNISKVMTFQTRTTADSQVYIDQLGNDNKITIEQTGNKDNYVNYSSNGSFNTTTINQTSTSSLQTNFVDLSVNGNSNLINIDQNSYNAISNFGKGAFINIADDNNSLTIQQKDGGSHYASVILSGGNKHVDILQQGAANHMTDINLSGQPVDLSLQQSGATQQYYSINFNCATAPSCAPIQVQQGQ